MMFYCFPFKLLLLPMIVSAFRSVNIYSSNRMPLRMKGIHESSDRNLFGSIKITAESNDKVKLMRSLDDSKARNKSGLIRLEGHRQVVDAIKCGLSPVSIMYTERALYESDQGGSTTKAIRQELSQILYDIDNKNIRTPTATTVTIQEVTESVMKSITDTVTNQGIVASFYRPQSTSSSTFTTILSNKKSNQAVCVLVLDGISDPGNMGSLIRSAVAFDVDCVVSVGGCDIWSPKVIRSSMGLILQMPILEMSWKDIETQYHEWNMSSTSPTTTTTTSNSNKSANSINNDNDNKSNKSMREKMTIYMTDGHPTAELYHTVNLNQSCMIVLGSEANGISAEAREIVQRTQGKYIRIPMNDRVESLNAAVAGSIVLSEMIRQRTNIL